MTWPVWNKGNPATAVILGTIKEGGLDVYKADGTVVQTIGAGGGRFNNVDLVYPVVAGDQTPGLAIVSDRATDKLHVFARRTASVTPPVTEVTAANVPLVFGTTQARNLQDRRTESRPGRTPSGTVEVFVSAGEHDQPAEAGAHWRRQPRASRTRRWDRC